MRELTVYSRSGCHLCELLIEDLAPMCESAGVRLNILDVDGQQSWKDRYGLRVPVVCDGENEISAWPLDEGRVRRWLGARRPAG
ncbi:MAG: glutaredoxin family protein [Gammaproteobacteria bacterium]|nr:MAG: glutaredoxin family protein [Gammaproteobacteria bacterium]